MIKPTLIFQGPVKSQSGYGSHSRDLLKSLYDMDLFKIKIVSTKWGSTPLTSLCDNEFHNWIEDNIIYDILFTPDLFIQVSVADEFIKKGKFNIGITAGVETNLLPLDFINGSNNMDLIIVPSNFTKNLFLNTKYNEVKDNVIINEFKFNKPIEVLFEGVNTEIFKNYNESNNDITNFLNNIDSDFCMLFVGHWLDGDIGEDRKNIGNLIKYFIETFKDENKKPCLILKTSLSTYSVIDRENVRNKILNIIGDEENIPNIQLLYGELTDNEMNELYNHPKIKSMVSITKGEGFNRTLLEFSMTGKPIITSNWSGHLDFIDNILVDGELTKIHHSSVNKYLIEGSMWFTVNENDFKTKLYDLYRNYDYYLKNSNKLMLKNNYKFSLNEMTNEFKNILLKYINIPYEVKLKLPNI